MCKEENPTSRDYTILIYNVQQIRRHLQICLCTLQNAYLPQPNLQQKSTISLQSTTWTFLHNQPTKTPHKSIKISPPVKTWMSSRSLEPLQPSPWAALAPSPTLVWPAKKKHVQDLILIGDSWYTGPWCKDSRFEIRTVSSGKKTCLPENHPSFHD